MNASEGRNVATDSNAGGNAPNFFVAKFDSKEASLPYAPPYSPIVVPM